MTLSLVTMKSLSRAAAEAIAAAALARAAAIGVPVSITILDAGGQLLHFTRADGVHSGTIAVSQRKAETAHDFRRSTAILGERLAAGELGLLSIEGLIPLGGGLPLIADGGVVGSIGVSGGRPEQDDDIAAAGAAILRGEAA